MVLSRRSFYLASKSYSVISIALLCTMLYTFQCVLHTLFYKSQPKAGAVYQIIHPCFCKRFAIGQGNVQAATAEDEEQYTLT